VTGSEPRRLDRLRRAIRSHERQLNRRGWTLGVGAAAEPQPPEDAAAPARPAHDSTGPPPAGWYDDPEAEGVRRYWNGTVWTDSRVTTEGIPYQLPADVRASRAGTSFTGLFLAAVLLIGGGVCLWVAENYKPTLGNELGLNGNSHVLTPGAYHTLMIVGIVCLVFGAIRLLTALLR
jgi:hypothetical protein